MSKPQNNFDKLKKIHKLKQEHKERAQKIDNFRNNFTKFENHEINKDQFTKNIEKDIGTQNSKKINNILSKSGLDKVTYQEMLHNSGLLGQKKAENSMNNLKGNININLHISRHNNRNKNTNIFFSNAEPNNFPTYNEVIRDSTSKFLNNRISSADYKKVLQKEGYNTNGEKIKKLFKQKEEINYFTYRNTMTTLSHNKNDTYDSSNFQYKKPKESRFSEDQGIENKEQLMVYNREKNEYNPLMTRKKFDADNKLNAFKSDKHLFEWERIILTNNNPEKIAKTKFNNQKKIMARNLYVTDTKKLEKVFSPPIRSNRKNVSSIFSEDKVINTTNKDCSTKRTDIYSHIKNKISYNFLYNTNEKPVFLYSETEYLNSMKDPFK